MTVAQPDVIAVGEEFTLQVDVSNPHDTSITLDSIDMVDALLEPFQLVSVEPDPKSSEHIPLLDERSWSFERRIPAHESLRVSFRLRAIREGRFTGNIAACNLTQDCGDAAAEVVVVRRSGRPAG